MANVTDVFSVFIVMMGAGGASSGALYWLLNQPIFEELPGHESSVFAMSNKTEKITIKEKMLKLSADDKAALLLVFAELKHTYFCKLQYQPMPFQFPLPQKEWLNILKNPVDYSLKASRLQHQFIDYLKETLQNDLALYQQLAKQILKTSNANCTEPEDYELKRLILKRTVLWQLALELCLITLNVPTQEPYWQPENRKQSNTVLKANPTAYPEQYTVDACWQLLEMGKPHLNKRLSQHFKDNAFAKRYHYQTFAPLYPADSDTLMRYATNTPLFA